LTTVNIKIHIVIRTQVYISLTTRRKHFAIVNNFFSIITNILVIYLLCE